MRIVTYNAHGNTGSIAPVLQHLQAHIIALNEVYEGTLQYLTDELYLQQSDGDSNNSDSIASDSNDNNNSNADSDSNDEEEAEASTYAYGFFGASHNLFGNALLTTCDFPMLDAKNYVLKARSQQEHARSLICAAVGVPCVHTSTATATETECGCYLNIFVVHLEHVSEKVRHQQMQEVLAVMEEWKQQQQHQQPTCARCVGDVLLGDLNAVSRDHYTESQWQALVNLRQAKGWTEGTDEVGSRGDVSVTAEPLQLVVPKLQANGWCDVWKAANNNDNKNNTNNNNINSNNTDCSGSDVGGFTAWSEMPMMRIDYIWCSQLFLANWQLDTCHVCATFPKASDHLPVTMTCTLLNNNVQS